MLHNAAQGDQLPIIVRELLAAHNTKALFSSSDHLRYRQGPTATARCLRAPIRASGSPVGADCDQTLLITNKKRRTRKKPGPTCFIW